MYLGLNMGVNWYYSPKVYFIVYSLITSCIAKMLMPSLQYHNKSSFCCPDKFVLSSVPTKEQQKFDNSQTFLVAKIMFQWRDDYKETVVLQLPGDSCSS